MDPHLQNLFECLRPLCFKIFGRFNFQTQKNSDVTKFGPFKRPKIKRPKFFEVNVSFFRFHQRN